MGKYDFTKEADATTRELADEFKKLGALDDEKLKELLPERTDQEELKKLIAAVNQATSENEKKAVLVERLGIVTEVVKNAVVKYVPKLIDLAT